MLSIMNEIESCLLLPLCVLCEIQNQIYHQKAPVLNEETKKGQRVVTPQVDQNNKTRHQYLIVKGHFKQTNAIRLSSL